MTQMKKQKLKEDQDNYNALWNCNNPNQDQKKYPTVLCVCSAGLLRSPSIAHVLANNGYNTRAAGVYDYALVRVSEVLLTWASKVVCADVEHAKWINDNYPGWEDKITVLNIPDRFQYREKFLIEIIEEKLKEIDFE